VLVVAGARPNFVKVAPIIRELESRGFPTTFVHTGQHYSAEMSDDILRDLELREPDLNLEVGSASHATQTARVMEAFEPVVVDLKPAWVVVVGDVNSTLASALVVAKLKGEVDVRLAHVEAGLRSRDWHMPEEINRVVTDRVADLLLTPSHDARDNLLAEGIGEEKIVFVGNVMIDSLLTVLPRARESDTLRRLGLTKDSYVLVTVHRPSNVDTPESLEPILAGLDEISRSLPVVLPLHPRTKKNVERFGLSKQLSSLTVSPPLGYAEMLGLTDGAGVVMTDSGGLQEETTVLGVPCVTLRERTERPVTVTQGTNRMASWPLTTRGIIDSFRDAREQGRVPVGSHSPDGWDGRAAARIVEAFGLFRAK
jgi:UDP-N-acetylglucosamine 2-epimerase (non-hydrolysing)